MIHYSFHSKVAVITGAGQGIGLQISLFLAKAGASIVLNDIDSEKAQLAIKEIQSIGGKCISVVGDAGEIEIIKKMVYKAIEEFGSLDFAIANAGITTFGNFLDYSQTEFNSLLRLNLQGSFFLAQEAAKYMIKNQIKGRLIFMSSVTGFTFHPDLTAYGMSKAALAFLAKTLGVDLAKHQITVNAIAPGATQTQRTSDLDDGNYVETWKKITPNGRCATTDDIAHATLFFLTEEAKHLTGQTLIIDGGWTSLSPSP
ncbi:MAG: SDR family oxidoreductase [Flavobacteriaceae bacterium]|jgi:glucose 1-dehydrogenase